MFQKIRSVAGGVIFLLLCAGGALAMPAAFNTEPEEEATTALDQVTDDSQAGSAELQGETTEVTVPDYAEDQDDGDDPDVAEETENHGLAVSTAAHCDLKGRAKGQLVKQIARDKQATVETAQAACDASLAAHEAGAASAKPAKPAHAGKPAKPAHAGQPAKPAQAEKPVKTPKPAKPAKAPRPTEAAEEKDDVGSLSAPGGPAAEAGTSGKGSSKKP